MNFAEDEELVALRDMLRRYLASNCPIEKAARWDREDFIPREELLKLGELGICGICVPEEHGGLGFNVIGMVAVIEELARYSAGLATYYAMCAVGAGFGVAETGSEKQKSEILPNVVKGDVAFSYGLSEPGVGADLGNVTTRGDRDGDRIMINGAKRWTSGASMNEYISALVRTGPPEDKRNNLSFVLVPTNAPGVTITELGSMGHNGTPLTDVTFDDVELTIDDVLGGGEGWNNGWSILAGPWLESEKLVSPAIALGIAEAALAEAWTYSQERIQGGKRICGHQTIRHALSDARTELQACRLMLMHAAWLVQERKPSAVATSMAKLFVAEKAKAVTLTCQQQVMGAYGYAHGFQMERYVRDSLAVPIYGGSSAVMRNNIANLLKLPRS